MAAVTMYEVEKLTIRWFPFAYSLHIIPVENSTGQLEIRIYIAQVYTT